MEKPMSLIILGPQGSGKGTQAKLLQDKFGHTFIGTGDALREIAKTDTQLGRKVHQTINVEGRLAEAELVAKVIEEKLNSIPKNQPVVIEGFPRTIRQYELMKEFWARVGRGDYIVLFIELSEDETLKRLTKRQALEGRHDDTPEAIKMRLNWSKQETMPMISEMEKQGKVIRINGAPSIEEVHREILTKLSLRGSA